MGLCSSSNGVEWNVASVLPRQDKRGKKNRSVGKRKHCFLRGKAKSQNITPLPFTYPSTFLLPNFSDY